MKKEMIKAYMLEDAGFIKGFHSENDYCMYIDNIYVSAGTITVIYKTEHYANEKTYTIDMLDLITWIWAKNNA